MGASLKIYRVLERMQKRVGSNIILPATRVLEVILLRVERGLANARIVTNIIMKNIKLENRNDILNIIAKTKAR